MLYSYTIFAHVIILSRYVKLESRSYARCFSPFDGRE